MECGLQHSLWSLEHPAFTLVARVLTTHMKTLTLDERERIADSALKIQSVRDSLKMIAAHKIPSMRELMECLRSVDENLRESLGYFRKLDVPRTSE